MPLTMYFPVRTWSRYKYRINPTSPAGSRGGNITPSLTHHPHSVVRANHHTNVNPSPPPPLNNTPFSKIPRSLQTYVSGLKHAPGKSITAFLILHELTAVVPFGLVWWGVRTLDLVSVAEDPGGDGAVLGGAEDADGVGLWEEVHRVWRRWVDRGMETWGGYASRKGYLDKLDAKQAAKVLLELGTAWAVVKALFPLRIMACLWATPWFARAVLGRVGGAAGRAKEVVLQWARRRR